MQLKLKRSQREGGVISKTAIFCLDARVGFTPAEQQSITRYKLNNQVIYNSEASKRHLDRADAHRGTGTAGEFKAIGALLMAAMKLNITIHSLSQGQHIECKSLDELLGAEDAIMEACRNLKGYLDAAATFDGREVLVDFDTSEPTIIAQSVTPAPILVVEPTAPKTQPALAHIDMSASAAIEQEPPQPTEHATFAASDTAYGVAIDSPLYRLGKAVRSKFDPGPRGEKQMQVMGATIAFIILLLLFI